ncbi:MAG: J domain-containing protein [Puniceicoccales bacterium]|nr:J domain-containing protein [Puniceicoccales bacterium]
MTTDTDFIRQYLIPLFACVASLASAIAAAIYLWINKTKQQISETPEADPVADQPAEPVQTTDSGASQTNPTAGFASKTGTAHNQTSAESNSASGRQNGTFNSPHNVFGVFNYASCFFNCAWDKQANGKNGPFGLGGVFSNFSCNCPPGYGFGCGARGQCAPNNPSANDPTSKHPNGFGFTSDKDKGVRPVNHYTTLGISPNATIADIRRAAQKLLIQFHPDKNKTKGAAEKFQQILEARDGLIDPAKRAEHDARLGYR